MSYNIKTPDVQKTIATKGPFKVVEFERDPSVNFGTAQISYFAALMQVRRRQVMCKLAGTNTIVTQSGAMQWSAGNVNSTTGVKGVGDMAKKMFSGAVTGESAIKPEYVGNGLLTLEPTYKYILLEDVAEWNGGLVVEDGMFLACEGSVNRSVIARSTVSSVALGKEGLFNLSLNGRGVAVLESNVPREELIEVNLENDMLKIDGSYAVCWSGSLQFTVERSSKTLIGSAVNGEGFVNVYRGTGKVLLCPTAANTSSMFATTSE